MRQGYHNLVRPEILNLIPSTSKSILDLGCGTGALGKEIRFRQPCHVTGIELNKEAVEIAKKNLDVAICDNLNRYNPTLSSARYDTIILADILEHLISPWGVLKKFAYVLTDGGTVIASIPNAAHPWIVSQMQRGLFRYEPAGILDITHLRFFTKTTIGQLFYKAGLKITKITPWPNENNPTQYLVTAVKPLLEHKKPIATILILTLNGWKFTAQCIDSIKAHTVIPYKIIVIDNGSTDETVQNLRKDTSIFHIENTCNLGFAAGFNVGLELVNTPYFAICNSDIVVSQKWLKHLAEHLSEKPDLMAIGPRSNKTSGPQKVNNCAYSTPQELVNFSNSFATTKENPVAYCKRIVFFCTLFKQDILHKVGFLDEIYAGGNFEDDDYCMRIWKKGFKSAIDNTVFVHHYGSQTFKQNQIDFKKSLEENGQRFLKKWKFNNMDEYYESLIT